MLEYPSKYEQWKNLGFSEDGSAFFLFDIMHS